MHHLNSQPFANKNSKHTKTANKLRNKISKNSEFGNQIAEVFLARKRGHSPRNNVLAPIWSWGLGILKWNMSKQGTPISKPTTTKPMKQ